MNGRVESTPVAPSPPSVRDTNGHVIPCCSDAFTHVATAVCCAEAYVSMPMAMRGLPTMVVCPAAVVPPGVVALGGGKVVWFTHSEAFHGDSGGKLLAFVKSVCSGASAAPTSTYTGTSGTRDACIWAVKLAKLLLVGASSAITPSLALRVAAQTFAHPATVVGGGAVALRKLERACVGVVVRSTLVSDPASMMKSMMKLCVNHSRVSFLAWVFTVPLAYASVLPWIVVADVAYVTDAVAHSANSAASTLHAGGELIVAICASTGDASV
jgi:hypothetical protein